MQKPITGLTTTTGSTSSGYFGRDAPYLKLLGIQMQVAGQKTERMLFNACHGGDDPVKHPNLKLNEVQ